MAITVNQTLVQAVGAAAGLCSVVSFIPQIRKLVSTRDGSGVSLKTYSMTAIGFMLWTAYGILSGSLPVAAANAVSLALVIVILALRIRYGDGQ